MDESGKMLGIMENKDGVERELKQEVSFLFSSSTSTSPGPQVLWDNSGGSLRSIQSAQVGMPMGLTPRQLLVPGNPGNLHACISTQQGIPVTLNHVI